ncbi:hypothetical protein Rcae01_02390 [Novipirellula caenicola]|uniref:Uncharacterized protein n=1 Tax=Novipirellula caenicola TaxID=1536901 RepID=A0ABP9VP19_9BACT
MWVQSKKNRLMKYRCLAERQSKVIPTTLPLSGAKIQRISILPHAQSRGHTKRIDSENRNDHPSPPP